MKLISTVLTVNRVVLCTTLYFIKKLIFSTILNCILNTNTGFFNVFLLFFFLKNERRQKTKEIKKKLTSSILCKKHVRTDDLLYVLFAIERFDGMELEVAG